MANLNAIVNTLAALGAGTARRFGDEAARVRMLPCLVTGGLSVAAHIVEDGGRFDLVPLSEEMEAELREVGAEAFGVAHGLDLRAEADRVALLPEAPLGVRGLAQQWVARHALRPSSDPEDLDMHPEDSPYYEPDFAFDRLDDYEREALLGLVQREMERASKRVYDGLFDDVGARLSHGEIESIALDRDMLAAHISQLLDITTKQALALCEAAGWPS